MTERVAVGVSLKMYFGHREAIRWFTRVRETAAAHPAVVAGTVELFVIPTYLQLQPALDAFAGTHVRIGAQDVSSHDVGAFTGEVSAVELSEIGVQLAEIGHAERRRLFGETDEVVAAKTAAALRNGITPVLCVGEADRVSATDAAAATIAQVRAALADAGPGSVTVAYEPVWAIGAANPAPVEHIRDVVAAVRDDVRARRPGSIVIYGGSAGPGLLTQLGEGVDGLFLGRFAHDPDALIAVLDEASALAASRRSGR